MNDVAAAVIQATLRANPKAAGVFALVSRTRDSESVLTATRIVHDRHLQSPTWVFRESALILGLFYGGKSLDVVSVQANGDDLLAVEKVSSEVFRPDVVGINNAFDIVVLPGRSFIVWVLP